MADQVENTFTQEEIDALEAEHENIAVLNDGDDGRYTFIIKPAEPLQWKAFETKASNEDNSVGATATLIEATVVAVAYKGEKATEKAAARLLWKRLLKGCPAAASGKDAVRQVLRVNGAASAARGK